jgi:UDP-N-acetyl-D-mannosaminuronic acid dehydrogenase
MTVSDKLEKIKNKQARLAVIGLGYVGLPVACMYAEAGFDVVGVDVKDERIQKINAGESPIEGDEPGFAELLQRVVSNGKLRATTRYEDLQDRDVVLICVETPVDDQHFPRYAAMNAALRSLGSVLQPGMLVVIESTIAPGTMSGLVQPVLEEISGMRASVDFQLGCCPERVMPGRLLSNLRKMSRVCGGGDEDTTQVMLALYRCIVEADLDSADWITAELTKTVENAYRDVQIAFANEVALICEAAGGDVWKVRELVNKSPYRQMHLPGAGVGGHCIPKDPWLLVHGVRDQQVPVRLIPSARSVNDGMPLHIVEMLRDALKDAGRDLSSARVLVLGFAYLEDSDDTRNSPSEVLVDRLQQLGAEVVIHDPFVPEYMGDAMQMAQECDAAVVMVSHSAYKQMDFAALAAKLNTPILVDGRNLGIEASGDMIVRTIGIGKKNA